MKKIVGYCRGSTENQKEEKTILVQEQNIRDYAKKNNFKLVKIFSDEAISVEVKASQRGQIFIIDNWTILFIIQFSKQESVIVEKMRSTPKMKKRSF